MNRIFAIALFASILIGAANAAYPAGSSDQQLLPLIKEIQAQQAAIAANQAKIDAKLLTVAEAVRVARIYSSRGGH